MKKYIFNRDEFTWAEEFYEIIKKKMGLDGTVLSCQKMVKAVDTKKEQAGIFDGIIGSFFRGRNGKNEKRISFITTWVEINDVLEWRNSPYTLLG